MSNVQGITFRSSRRPAIPGTEYKRPGSVERIVGNNGHINANNKADLMSQIQALITASNSGSVDMTQAESNKVTAAANREKLVTAWDAWSAGDRKPWTVLGSAIGAELSVAADRDGFMRRVLLQGDVTQGSLPRVRVKQKNVIGAMATGPTTLTATVVRDNYLLPPEFYVVANVRVEEREIAQGSGDILEDKFFEGNEAVMVREDRQLKNLLDSTIGLYNSQQILAGGLSPATFSAMRSSVTRWNIPAQTALMASDLWQDITGNSLFAQWFDPVSQYEIVTTGYLGQILGLGLITDAFRQPTLKVLNAGEIYVLGAQEMLGAYTTRGPVNATPQDNYADGVPARGWSFWELLTETVANGRAVVKGIRS